MVNYQNCIIFLFWCHVYVTFHDPSFCILVSAHLSLVSAQWVSRLVSWQYLWAGGAIMSIFGWDTAQTLESVTGEWVTTGWEELHRTFGFLSLLQQDWRMCSTFVWVLCSGSLDSQDWPLFSSEVRPIN